METDVTPEVAAQIAAEKKKKKLEKLKNRPKEERDKIIFERSLLSVNWNAADNEVEILVPRTGKTYFG
jgi:hypothetical protein